VPRVFANLPLLAALGALAACGSSSGDDGSSVSITTDAESGESGELMRPQAGTYLVEVTKKTGMCRTEEEMASWTLTMPLPDEDGSWELSEDYSGEDVLRQAPYPCNLTGNAAICNVNKDRDYTSEMMGITAVVVAKRSWEFDWTSETEFEGMVQVDLRCVGSGCNDIASDYLVAEWDCLTVAELTGTLQ
jgi:hypothetical protein